METNQEIKKVVKQKYAEIVSLQTSGCGCGCGAPEKSDFSSFQDDYSGLNGYVEKADLGLGCGVPTQFADIKSGDTVVDLGSGAGNDVFVARSIVGENGRVIGIDMTEEMISAANRNKEKLGYSNVEFKLGDIENLPISNDTVDVVISNCVLNLVPDKTAAFNEMHRILKSGGHFCISVIVLVGEIPNELKKSAEASAGCVSGALQKDDYLRTISDAGFKNIEVKSSKQIILPEQIVNKFLSESEAEVFMQMNTGIFSITVNAEK